MGGECRDKCTSLKLWNTRPASVTAAITATDALRQKRKKDEIMYTFNPATPARSTPRRIVRDEGTDGRAAARSRSRWGTTFQPFLFQAVQHLARKGTAGLLVRAFPAQRSHNVRSVLLANFVHFHKIGTTYPCTVSGFCRCDPVSSRINVTKEMRHGLEDEGLESGASRLLVAHAEGHLLGVGRGG
jgi:hypothetical protein